MKKLICMAATLALLISLCACSSTAAPSETEETTTAADTAVTEAELAEEEEPAAEAEAPAEEAPAEETEEETAEPEETPEPETETETEEENAAESYEAWDIIQQYGSYDDGSSVLSYELDPTTFADEGDYYTVTATLRAGITVPTDLNEGDQVTVTTNDLTGETMTLTYNGDNTFSDESGYDGYYFFSSDADKGTAYLYQDSDDRVDSDIYVGTIRIAKGAQVGIAIIDTYAAIEDSGMLDGTDITYGDFYNSVTFDGNGCAVSLTYYGD